MGMDKAWRDNFSAQYAATIAAAMTIAMFGFAVAIGFWIWKSANVSKPIFSLIAFVLFVAVVCFGAVASWWKREQFERKERHRTPILANMSAAERAALLELAADAQRKQIALNPSAEDLHKERDALSNELKRTQNDLAKANTRVQTQQAQIKARNALLNPPVVPAAPELVQFVNAWFIPAWDRMMNLLMPIRDAIGTQMGDSVKYLFQLGAIDPAAASRRAAELRLVGSSNGDLNDLVAAMYEHYEYLVAWVLEGARMANWRFDNDARIGVWREMDGKLMDHLRGLVALPQFAYTRLYHEFRKWDQGDASRNRRRELEKRDARYDNGT